ncbi:hypothetical protein TNCV_3392401 [Trichonephila clavipes]|nr:hypothetical protein TNCV_3392401 [Trichonephila clavipes]
MKENCFIVSKHKSQSLLRGINRLENRTFEKEKGAFYEFINYEEAGMVRLKKQPMTVFSYHMLWSPLKRATPARGTKAVGLNIILRPVNSHLCLRTPLGCKQEKIICQVIYSQFGLAIHQNDHQARRRFVEWAQNEIAVVPDFHKRILFSDEAHFWLNGYVNKQNCRIWSEANPQVYVETPLHPEKLTVWCALWAGGILLQKR